MKNLNLLFIAAIAIGLVGCASKTKVDVAKLKEVKTAAVIMYTVPESIFYRDDPRKSEKSLLARALDMATKKNGPKAAKLSYQSFIESARKQDLHFKVLTYRQVVTNKNFTSLYVPPLPKEKKKGGVMGKALSLFGAEKPVAVSPEKVNQYGLANWKDATALTGQDGEKEYITEAIKALGVDAAIVINDPGYAFVCEACVSAGGQASGAASTGSAFNATVVDKTGNVILDMQEYFLTTDAQAAMVTGTVNPLQQEKLFKEHGKKMAIVFADAMKEKMTEKK